MTVVVAATISAIFATAAPAAETAQPREIGAVVACRTERDDTARLRCYDEAAAALSAATSSGSILVVDREDVRKTRRSLFGFSVPKLPFFRGDKSQDEEQTEIVAKIVGVRGLGYGKWQFDLGDSGVWQTTDASQSMRTPKSGQTVKVRKAALGSYFLTVENGRTVKGMRVR